MNKLLRCAMTGVIACGTAPVVCAQATSPRQVAAAARGDSVQRAVPAPEKSGLDLSLYGLANAGVDTYAAPGASLGGSYAARQRIFSSGSRIGLRGGMDLGVHNLRAVFQLESGVMLDNGSNTGQSGAVSISSGFLASRASFVGLEGHFGRVLVGKQDVYWLNGTVEQTAENYLSTGLPWMAGGNSGKASAAVALQSDVLSYRTPLIRKTGYLTLYYSPNASGVLGNSEVAPQGKKTSGKLLAASGSWSHNKLQGVADIAYRRNNGDNLPLATTVVPTTLALKVGVAWKPRAGTQLAVIATHVGATSSGFVLGRDFKQNTVSVNAETVRGSWQLLGQAGTAMKVTGCSFAEESQCQSTGAVGFLVGARYLINPSASVYGFATAVVNGANDFHDYSAYSYSSASPGIGAFGADPRIVGVGMRFNFDVVLSKAAGGR